jgi:hypothetical protein
MPRRKLGPAGFESQRMSQKLLAFANGALQCVLRHSFQGARDLSPSSRALAAGTSRQ